MTRAAVAGLGLIGGSAALALHARGYDRDPAARERASRLGIQTAESLSEAVRGADLVLLAAPTPEIPALMREAFALAPEALITDAASTKRPVAAAAAKLPASARFVGGHPMAGSKTPGGEGARADLFAGRPWLVVPTERSDSSSIEALFLAVRAIGALPLVVDAERHDALMTWISHLPLAAASALARAVSEAAGRDARLFAGPGLLDATRVADSPSDLSLELALADPESLAAAIERVREELAVLAGSLRAGGDSELRRWFEEAARARQGFERT